MNPTKRVNLALQGGGSHGAFTWGVLGSMAVVGTRSLDMSLTRIVRVTGTQDIEVRVDAFNAFNWLQWGQPATAFNNLATFGQITSAGAPRVMQFAVKYGF